MRIQRFVCAGIALLMVSACNGTSSTAIPAGPNGPLTPSSHSRSAKLELRLLIPRRRHHRRRSRYVSPSTQSIRVVEGQILIGTFDTTASSGKCKLVNGGTSCSFRTGIVPGANKTFTIYTYDGLNGAGNELSTGSVTKTIVAGYNVIPITLDGIVSSISVAVQGPSLQAGTAGSTGVTVMANDADGNTIIGPGAYENPIVLGDSDTSGATSLSPSTVNGPNDNVTLSYTGANLTSATIGASATGVSNVTTGTFVPVPSGVADFQLPSAIGANTGVALAPIAIANGPDGNLWFSAQARSGSPANAIFKMTTAGTFAAVHVHGVTTGLPDEKFTGLATGSDKNVWYVGTNSVGNLTTGGTATDYPFSGIAGGCAGIVGGGLVRIIPAADGGLWFTVNCTSGSQLIHVLPNGSFSANNLPSTTFSRAGGLVLATDTHVYVAGFDPATSKPAILQLAVSLGVASSPVVLDISGAGGSALQGITQTANGDLWATTGQCAPSVLIRVHVAGGLTPATTTVFPTLAGCAAPAWLQPLPDGSLWVAELDYAEALQVIPASGTGAPAQFALSMPTPQDVYGAMWDVTIGADHDLYFTNTNTNTAPNASGSIVKVAY